MAAKLKRFTISVPPGMDAELDHEKKGRYCNDTQSGMIRDLIIRGLNALDTQKKMEAGSNDLEGTG